MPEYSRETAKVGGFSRLLGFCSVDETSPGRRSIRSFRCGRKRALLEGRERRAGIACGGGAIWGLRLCVSDRSRLNIPATALTDLDPRITPLFSAWLL